MQKGKDNSPCSKFNKISQIGLVVSERDHAILSMRAIFGVEPSRTVLTREDDDRLYYSMQGDFQAELIFYNFCNIEIEFIVPLKGKSIWQDYLVEHGEGLHHIQFRVDDYHGACEDMCYLGIPVIQEGNSVLNIPDIKWGYLGTLNKLHFIIEITNSDRYGNRE